MDPNEDLPLTAKRAEPGLASRPAFDEAVEEARPACSRRIAAKFLLEARECRALRVLTSRPEPQSRLFLQKPVFVRIAAKLDPSDSRDSLDEFLATPRLASVLKGAEEALFPGLTASERNCLANTVLSTSADLHRPRSSSRATEPGPEARPSTGSPGEPRATRRSILRGDGPHSGGRLRGEASPKKKKVRFSATNVLIRFWVHQPDTSSIEDFHERILTKRSPQLLPRDGPNASAKAREARLKLPPTLN